ncbi:oxidoreductase [Kineosporia sp. NBRC 101677]|uniref:PQQ-dependent sugar dehydrogenase n=1 Tax=Kineosporia sp. NBRC 101677 TaxID=3032197 RepID=UPI0024A223B5|nr:PQQ-dependent sugar dehydrogenase [Kineosporia sp. NBRC 101677]GLY17436.1 oxidoreductase [Kineosporia sp. NBRC 101677]
MADTDVKLWSRRLAAAGVLVLGVAGCGAENDESESAASPPATTTQAAPATQAPETSSIGSVAIDLSSPEEVATGIEVPWGLAFLPNGDALVAERDSARVLRIPAEGGAPEPVYEVPGVSAEGEGGLLGLAVSPEYDSDETVYAYYTASGDNRIVRFQLDGGKPEVIFDGIARNTFHNGGRIAFGPDGLLYVGTGDAGDTATSQDQQSVNGKILRLTPEGEPAPGNPENGSPVYSSGHRNVQGLAWDAEERLFAAEFGQNELDEVNLIEPGRNYGWPEVEGEGDTDGGRFTNPLVTWSTDEASPSGIAIAGDMLFVAALRGERLWTVPLTGGETGEPEARFEGDYGRLRTVEAAPDGSLWLTTSNTDGRGDVQDGDDRILRFPAAG